MAVVVVAEVEADRRDISRMNDECRPTDHQEVADLQEEAARRVAGDPRVPEDRRVTNRPKIRILCGRNFMEMKNPTTPPG